MRLTETVVEIDRSLKRGQRNANELGAPIDLNPPQATLAPVLRSAEGHAEKLFGHRESLELLPATPALVAKCRDALHLLRKVWPGAYDELVRTVRCLVFFRGRRVIGFTDFRCHGAVFLNHDKIVAASAPWETAEELLHEASHNRLNAELAVSPMFTNDPTATYASPLRPDPRPMFGVFHQMYVLARLNRFYALLEPHLSERIASREATGRGFLQAFDVVERHAKLTPSGAQLVDALRREVAIPLRSSHGLS